MIKPVIYARKSVEKDSGNSIDTQIKLCKEYIQRHYSNYEEPIIFFDEGYTGANINRPDFQKMMENIKQFTHLFCYRLDRISRSVSDFSQTYQKLEEAQVSFISITEQIDTSSPMGRAMMYIASVFAQMERETIAERVKDSSRYLAESGKWAGGIAPVGYKRVRIIVDGKECTTLEENVEHPEEKQYVLDLFEKYTSGMSFTSIETYCKNNNLLSPRGNRITTRTIYQIICNPVYAPATSAIWDYYEKKGCKMTTPRDSFDGTSACIAYGRTSGGKKKKHVNNDISQWIISKGLHKPLISEETFLKAQENTRHNIFAKKRRYDFGLLRGILHCKKCGCTMSAKRKIEKLKDGSTSIYYYYACNGHARSRCNCKQINLKATEKTVIDTLKNLSIDKSLIKSYVPVIETPQINYKKEIKKLEEKIQRLVGQLVDTPAAASKYIKLEIEKIDNEINNLKKEAITQRHEVAKLSADEIWELINDTMKNFDNLNFEEQHNILKIILKECVWDEESQVLEIKIV